MMKWNEATVFFMAMALLYAVLGIYELYHLNLIMAFLGLFSAFLCGVIVYDVGVIDEN